MGADLAFSLNQDKLPRWLGPMSVKTKNSAPISSGELEVELCPQGTAERLRAAGAGIPAFYTPTALRAEGRETRSFDDREYLLEHALGGDFALSKLEIRTEILFLENSQKLNPLVAKAARITIAEVEELVPAGELDADEIHLPGIYIQRVIQGQNYNKWIEQRTVREREGN